MNSKNYIDGITELFVKSKDDSNAYYMKKYMKNLFDFFGIKAPGRKDLTKIYFAMNGLPEKNELADIVKDLWSLEQREYQYFGMELLNKFSRELEINDVPLLEFLITNKSWWDTVDYLAANPVGTLFASNKILKEKISNYWNDSENMWLKRTAIIFQLKYKSNTDVKLLGSIIESNKNSEEFFIQKAMGWALREYGKTDPGFVVDFVNKVELPRLSKREALRRINN